MTQIDMTYRRDGIFTRFYAETPAGEEAWRAMADQCGGVAAVLGCQEADTVRQLRAAGYTVRKAKPHDISIDELLAELDA